MSALVVRWRRAVLLVTWLWAGLAPAEPLPMALPVTQPMRLPVTLPVTLRQAVALAVRQNPTLAAAGAALAAADGAVLAARGLDDAELFASAEARPARGASEGGVAQQPRADELFGAVQLAQPLPTGGRVTLGLETAYARGPRAAAAEVPGMPGERWTPALQLELVQPLLRGAGKKVARAEQRRTRFAREQASAEREGAAARVVREVVEGYWRAVFASGVLDIRRASALAAREQLERVHASIGVGKLPPSAAAEIEVAIALRDDAVLLAEQALLEHRLELGRLCGLQRGEQLQPSEALPPIDLAARAPRGHEASLVAALAYDPQLQVLRARQRELAVEQEVSADALLPRLDLSLAGGPAGNAADAGAASEQLAEFGGYAVLASLSLQLPLARRAARGALEVAQGRSRQAQLSAAEVAAALRAAVASTLGALETARRRALLLVPAQRAAALDLEAEKARFEAGRASNFDVLRRQDALAAAQLALRGAELSWLEAEAAHAALTGELLPRHGVALGRVEP